MGMRGRARCHGRAEPPSRRLAWWTGRAACSPKPASWRGRRGLFALINDALRIRLQHARVGRLLDEMDEEFEAVPAAIEEEVRREWPVAGRFPSA